MTGSLETPPESARPLQGVRVLDLTNVLAGPFATHQLAHLGAEVIKIEHPQGGDLARELGMDESLSAEGMGISFLAPNPGKQSVTLNLKHDEGRRILERLVTTADVLVENFRPGVMDRLGLSADHLRDLNPSLVYCAISGFGQDGPLKDRPAYDQIVQGLSGAMAITGTDDATPLRAGWPVADTVGGLTAAMAICAALNAPKRGCVIDIAMLDSLMATMGWAVSNLLIGGVAPVPAGNENLTSAPSAAFRTADGLLNIAANKQEQWEALADHIGLSELKGDPAFQTRMDRRRHRDALNAAIEEKLMARPAMEWEDELNALGVPAGRILSMEDALTQPQFKKRDQVADFTLTNGREIKVLRTGAQIDGTAPSVNDPPPELGQHTDQVLADLGLTSDEIEHLRKLGAI